MRYAKCREEIKVGGRRGVKEYKCKCRIGIHKCRHGLLSCHFNLPNQSRKSNFEGAFVSSDPLTSKEAKAGRLRREFGQDRLDR